MFRKNTCVTRERRFSPGPTREVWGEADSIFERSRLRMFEWSGMFT